MFFSFLPADDIVLGLLINEILLLNKVQLICTNDHLYQGHHAQRRCPSSVVNVISLACKEMMQFFALEKTFCSTCPSLS